MRFRAVFIAAGVIVVLLNSACRPESDAHRILRRHYRAVGGITRIRQSYPLYYEGRIDLVTRGQSGMIRVWQKNPDCQRSEVEFSEVRTIRVRTAEGSWSQDYAGRIHIRNDSLTQLRNRLSSLTNRFEHLRPRSEIFHLGYLGVDTSDSSQAHHLRLVNRLNADTTDYFYRPTDYYLIRTIVKQDDRREYRYSDFRSIGGLIVPFQTVIRDPASGVTEMITIETYQTAATVADSLFDPPPLLDYR